MPFKTLHLLLLLHRATLSLWILQEKSAGKILLYCTVEDQMPATTYN